METSARWARAAAIALALLTCTACSSAPDATPEPSPSKPVTASPEPSTSGVAAPIDESFDCRFAMSILPVTDPTQGIWALRYDLIGQGSTEIAAVGVTVEGIVVTPSTAAADPVALVEAGVARVEAAGFAAPGARSLAPAVPWSFDDLCAGFETAFHEMGSPGGVNGVGVRDDAHLEIAIEPGSEVPDSIAALDAAHPCMLRIVEQPADVAADVG